MDDERGAKSNLFTVWKSREAELGERITYKDASGATKISTATLSRWMNGQVKRFDAHSIQMLCEYFQCEVGELILLDEGGQEADQNAP